ncbi:hypothetical protein D3C73_1249370 [compost metagenome]
MPEKIENKGNDQQKSDINPQDAPEHFPFFLGGQPGSHHPVLIVDFNRCGDLFTGPVRRTAEQQTVVLIHYIKQAILKQQLLRNVVHPYRNGDDAAEGVSVIHRLPDDHSVIALGECPGAVDGDAARTDRLLNHTRRRQGGVEQQAFIQDRCVAGERIEIADDSVRSDGDIHNILGLIIVGGI